jgi:proline dehydrogenase
MTRQLFLLLSRQRALRRWMETSPLSRRITSRFIAGQTLDDELAVCRRLYSERILATVDRLGENVNSLEEAAAARDAYLSALDRVAGLNIGATLSVKLTQFGLDFSPGECLANARQLVAKAKALGTRIEIDMESSAYTDRTLDIVMALHTEFGAVRAVIQAYLKRTAADIGRLCEAGVPVRLCKGAYDESPEVAFATKAAVDANYAAQMKILLDRGTYPALATHDANMISAALAHIRECKIPADRFEFQMLYGIRRDLQARLVRDGYTLRVYVPYGDAWYPYFMRRLAERPANVFFLVRNLLRG